MSARTQQASDVKFPGSKLSAVAFAAVLLAGATAWIGARERRTEAADTAPQQPPASAPVPAPQRPGPNGGYARTNQAPARPRPATRTRAS